MSYKLLTVTIVVVFCAVLSLPITASTASKITIVNTAFTVRAGDARYWNFRVGRDGANVIGRFRAEGGGGNDIKCLILDGDSFENWRNGHTVNTYYNSGKITVANINVRLGESNYILVFDNTYSVLTSKAVTANVDVRW
jgi:hypothetical protein